MAWLTYSTSENPRRIRSQPTIPAASAPVATRCFSVRRCLVLAVRRVTNHTSCSGHRSRTFHVSCRCVMWISCCLVLADRVATSRIDTRSLPVLSRKKKICIAATVVAHVFAAAVAAQKASPSWLLPSYIYAAGSSAHRHPPPGCYQV
jgi:hypothetical protein